MLVHSIKFLCTVNIGIEKVLKPLIILVVFLMLFSIIYTVAARYIAIDASWTDKFMLILLPVLSFIVAPTAYRKGAFISLDFIRNKLPPRILHLHSLFVHLVVLYLILISLDLSMRKVGFAPDLLSSLIDLAGPNLGEIRPFKAPIKIPVINIQWRYVYMVMPLSIFLMILANLELIMRSILKIINPDQAEPNPVTGLDGDLPIQGE